ncbi:MAG: hypothetical protein V1716_04020 [Candidatus Uhrbacteria bacterium]
MSIGTLIGIGFLLVLLVVAIMVIPRNKIKRTYSLWQPFRVQINGRHSNGAKRLDGLGVVSVWENRLLVWVVVAAGKQEIIPAQPGMTLESAKAFADEHYPYPYLK